MANKVYYLIDDTSIHSLITVAGSFMVVLNTDKKPVWCYDFSKGYINISLSIPTDLTLVVGASPKFENINVVPKRLANAVNKYLAEQGYSNE